MTLRTMALRKARRRAKRFPAMRPGHVHRAPRRRGTAPTVSLDLCDVFTIHATRTLSECDQILGGDEMWQEPVLVEVARRDDGSLDCDQTLDALRRDVRLATRRARRGMEGSGARWREGKFSLEPFRQVEIEGIPKHVGFVVWVPS